MSGFDLIIKPDPDEIEAGEVFVEGTIDGHPYQFLLDTGAARTSIVSDVYTSTLASSESHSSSGVFAAHQDDLVILPTIQVGPITRANFKAARMPSADIHNLIGMDLLKDFCLHFLFDQNRVVVESVDVPLLDLFLGAKFHPYVDVQFGSLFAKAVWDTGASITVVDLGFIQRNPMLFTAAGQSSGTDSTGATMDSAMYIMGEAIIGGMAFAPHKIAAVDLSFVNTTTEVPMDLILGYSTLRQANWLFNFPRRQWAITKRL